MPLVDEMNASLQRERRKGMHYISKSIYLRQVKVTDPCSASQNLSEKHIYMSRYETGAQVKKYRKMFASTSNNFTVREKQPQANSDSSLTLPK